VACSYRQTGDQMTTYQTKIRTTEAVRWNGQPLLELPIWAQDPHLLQQSGSALYAYSKNGPVRVNRGDWLIQGDKEIYPCTDETFQRNYEPARIQES
jgi:hypothetical protein